MNKFRSGILLYAIISLFYLSCGDGEDKKTDTDAKMADTTAVAPEPVVVNTISTTPQNMVIIRHKVADFAKWQAAYDGHDSARLANGLHNYVIGRGIADSNMVMIALKADDIAKAKAFAKDPGLKQAMQKGGVMGAPTVQYETTFFQDTLKLTTQIRSMTQFMVKDKDAWVKSFDEGKQERDDNGISARVIATDADNNKKIMLVTALADTAKARAYWNSDALKKRREAGGVIGVPERFVFQVVKRY